MKSLIQIVILLFAFSKVSVGQNTSWIELDKKLIQNVVKLDKKKPKEVESFFKENGFNRTEQYSSKISSYKYHKANLGFKWSMANVTIPGGYIAVEATFVYFNDSLLSYRIDPQLPSFIWRYFSEDDEKVSLKNRKKYLKKYKTWYNSFFPSDTTDVYPYFYNREKVEKPLDEYKEAIVSKDISKSLIEFISPFSWITYGTVKLQEFQSLKDSLTTQQIELAMYSINAASRLSALHYYFKNKEKFTNQEKIEAWANKVFNELPETDCVFGCLGGTYITRLLAKE